jgi:hypothetical protein
MTIRTMICAHVCIYKSHGKYVDDTHSMCIVGSLAEFASLAYLARL